MSDPSQVALCLFGQMRTYKRCYPYLKENVLDVLDPDVFVHTWEDRGGTWKANMDNNINPGTITREKLTELYDPKEAVIEKFHDEYYRELEGVSVPDAVWNLPDYQKGILPMFYKMYECNELKQSHECEEGLTYDIVVLMRPDLVVLEAVPEEVFANPNIFWVSGRGYYKIDDKILISSSANIDYATSIWGRLSTYWATQLHGKYGSMGIPQTYTEEDEVHIGVPERLLHYHMSRGRQDTQTHDIKAKVLRQDSQVYNRYLARATAIFLEKIASILKHEGFVGLGRKIM